MKALLLLAMFIIAPGVAYSVDSGLQFRVSPVPLTSEAQRKQGVPGGEGFQMVMTIEYAPSNPLIVYLASDTSQVWKSIDGGRSWSPKNNGYAALGSRSLFVHPHNENIVFSAGSLGKTFERGGAKNSHQGIYRSIDGGEHWNMVFETDFFKQDSRGSLFAIDSRTQKENEFTLYAGSYSDGLLVSKDGGVTWQKAGFSQGRIHEVIELPDAPGKLLIASDAGLFEYDGQNFRELGVGLATWPRSIAVSSAQPEVVLAALGPKGIYRSIDKGASFGKVLKMAQVFGAINDVEFSPVDADRAILTVSGKAGRPYYSDDGGQSWRAARSTNSKNLASGDGFFFPSPIAMHPKDSMTALTSSNSKSTVLVTLDGGQDWAYSGSGYRGGRLQDVAALSADEMIFGLTDHGAWRTTDGALSFKPLDHPRMGGRSIGGVAQAGATIVLSVGSWKTKQLLVSQDAGTTWQNTRLSGSLRFVENQEDSPNVFYAGDFRSDDNGKSWKKLQYEVVALDPTDHSTAYAIKSTGTGSQLLISTDSGNNWKETGATLSGKSRVVNSIAVDPACSNRVYAATSDGVGILLGNKWHDIGPSQGLAAAPLGGNYVESIVTYPHIPGLLLAGKRSPGKGMANGVFYSDDYGQSWQSVPDGKLSNTNVWSISVNPYDGSIYAGTSHGIYRIETIDGASLEKPCPVG